MAGLNNIISNTSQQTTTMPTWYDTAQQNIVNQAQTAAAAAPTPQNTVGQQAVNALSGPTNAFTQATGTLQNIASGAANPWVTDQATGQVSPNTQTAMGGLFQAQNQQLNQLLPTTIAPQQAGAVGSGNFGSLRGQTAVDTAKANALAQLQAQQYNAALQNQQTGVAAGSAAGNVAQQNINNLLTTGQYQQAAPLTNVSNLGKIIGGIQAPTTVSNQTQLSPLNQIAGLVSALGGSTGSSGILGSLGVSGGLTGLINSLKGAFDGGTSGGGTSGGGAAVTPDNGNYGPTPGGGNIDMGGGYGPTPGGGNIDTGGAINPYDPNAYGEG